MKIVCPKCGSQEITFGKDFVQGRYWEQTEDEETYWYDYELGDNYAVVEGQDIDCYCRNCQRSWLLGADIDDYLE